ncbi:MAG: hypothetical protein ACLUD0_16710 [Eubacterium ramulus]
MKSRLGMSVDRYKMHDIEIVIDKIDRRIIADLKRLKSSVATAMKHGKGVMMVKHVWIVMILNTIAAI